MPANTTLTLPVETGNTGKKLSIQSRTQGGDTVYRHRVLVDRDGVVTGVYRAFTTVLSVQATAQNGTSTGHFWLFNPSGSGRTARIRRLSLQYNFVGVTTLGTLPRTIIQRFTWTGTQSGAQIAGANVDAASVVASVVELRTASTGATVSLTANTQLAADLAPIAQVSGTPAVFETTPTYRSEMIDAESSEDEWIVIPPGQGIVLYQVDAGTASDTRRLVANIVWDEINLDG